MSGDLFKVRFIRSKTCFLVVPDKWVRKLQDLKKLEHDSPVKINYDNDKTAYFSWQQMNSRDDNVIGINATVATNLAISEGDLVSLFVCSNPPLLHRVEMSPLSSDDLEMIELNSGLLQATLLDQVRVVWKDQLLTVWISNSLPIVLRVGNMEPDANVGRLEQLTEVTIGDPLNSRAPTINGSEVGKNTVINSIVNSGRSLASSVVNAVKGRNTEEDECLENEVQTEEDQYIFRVHPLSSSFPENGPLDAFLPETCMLRLFHYSLLPQESLFSKIMKLPGTIEVSMKGSKPKEGNSVVHPPNKDGNENRFVFIRLVSAETLQGTKENFYASDRQCIYVSNNLRSILNLEIGSKVILSDFKARPPVVNIERVELLPYYGLGHSNLEKSFIQYLDRIPKGLLLCNKLLLTIPTEKGYIDAEVQLCPSSLSHILVLPGGLDISKVYVRLERRAEKQSKLLPLAPCVSRSVVEDLHLNHLQGLIDEGLSSLKLPLGLHNICLARKELAHMNNNVLISGKSGCGKTSTASALCNVLQSPPHYVYNAVIKCRPLKGKTVESLFKHVQGFIDDCVYHQPSILMIDDLECIAGAPEDHDQNSQISAYFNRIGRMLLQIFSSLQTFHSVAIIATARSMSSLSPALVPSRGIHMFNTCLELPELSKMDRQGILEKLLHQKFRNKDVRDLKCSDIVEECGKKTEGYCCQDLADLTDRATLTACMRQLLSNKIPVLESCDILQALSETTPMFLRGVTLHKDSTFDWDDIGGLTEVKNELKEVFEWPVMYPEIFQNSPLRQQSGLLLYGAPGTGKTMLAAAVASECGLNFISVKGPELLSKYIGASEEAVRNIFSKAQSAKPCVLFFDEFDSLAPRRGHDNTGVTDRVVNQLLTQLDGVESLVGVWVLAATSRPDLLDPALLRPGRLDRSILCPLPDEGDRLAILKALSRKMNFDVDVDLSNIAANTIGFTGADLQSLLYSAQLTAMEEQQSKISEGNSKYSEQQVFLTVTQNQLDFAANNTRPSLTIQERNKYLTIYKKFGPGYKEKLPDVLGKTQRATLA